MKTLSKNWLTEDLIDAEYKRYVLLAYLTEVGRHFDEKKLYPHLAELIEHHKQLKALKEGKQSLYAAFPDKVQGVDWEHLRLNYEKLIQDDALMAELEAIIDYSIPQFQSYLKTGIELYEHIEALLKVEPVGIMPLYTNEGYLFLLRPAERETCVYEYQITLFESAGERYRGIHTEYIATYNKTVGNTPEFIKTDLIRHRPKLPNPAVYLVAPNIEIPLMETYLPIAKRAVVKRLAA